LATVALEDGRQMMGQCSNIERTRVR